MWKLRHCQTVYENYVTGESNAVGCTLDGLAFSVEADETGSNVKC